MGKPTPFDYKSMNELPPPKARSGDQYVEPSSSTEPLLLGFDRDYGAPSKASTSTSPNDVGNEELPAYYDNDPTNLGEEPPPFSKYSPQKHLLGHGKVVSHDAHLNSDGEALHQWLQEEAASPPRPLLVLTGTHRARSTTQTGRRSSSSTSTATDFSLTFDLSSFLQPSCTLLPAAPTSRCRRGTRLARVANPHELDDARSIRDWCDTYIYSDSQWKEFQLRKQVTGLDEATVRLHVESIVRSTNYRGTVRITFPVENRTVVLAPDNWVCRVRYGWARWLFYLSFLWLLTWPVLWLGTKRWEVVEATFEAKHGAEAEWVDRWGWVLTRMVRQKRCEASPLTPQNLRWIECHERASEEERMARQNTTTGVRGFVGSFLRGLSELSENLGSGWGGDEW